MTQEEFEHIAPALRELMLSVGRSFFGNDDDAEDVAQEGLVALLRFIDRMESGIHHPARLRCIVGFPLQVSPNFSRIKVFSMTANLGFTHN